MPMCYLGYEIIINGWVFDHIPGFIKELLHPVFSDRECCPNIRAQEEATFLLFMDFLEECEGKEGRASFGGALPECPPPPLEFANTM